MRSSIDSAKDALTAKVCYLSEFLGGDCVTEGDYPAWEYRKESKLRDIMVDSYKELFGDGPEVKAIHAGLECGLFYEKIEGLDASSWGGFGSFRALLESLDLAPFKITWEGGGVIYDAKRHSVQPLRAKSIDGRKSDSLETKAVQAIKAEIAKAGQAVPCGRLATTLVALDSTLATDWAGKGTFRKFVESLDVKPVEFDWNGSGGIAYDPE